ncbi:hypothetical protein C1646_773411 [Rhizophagus diaphanus]|nr:hypothetical protein C1646_773411 [Rhizophagus diaphanus] [Rhizophagus sp. MUCL 43196]
MSAMLNRVENGEYADIKVGIECGGCPNRRTITGLQSRFGKLLRIGFLGGDAWKPTTLSKTCHPVHAHSCYTEEGSSIIKHQGSMSQVPVHERTNRTASCHSDTSILVDKFEDISHIATLFKFKILDVDPKELTYYIKCIAEFCFDHIIIIGETNCGVIFLDCCGHVFLWDDENLLLWPLGDSPEEASKYTIKGKDRLGWFVENGIMYEYIKKPQCLAFARRDNLSNSLIDKLNCQQRSRNIHVLQRSRQILSVWENKLDALLARLIFQDESNISRRNYFTLRTSQLHSLQFITMASEPSSATITSEPSTSTSEIQTNTSESSQLEVLALNYLQNQEISTIPTRILKINHCSICQRVILKFQFQSFVVMDCEHLFHCLCIEKYIMQAETKPPLTCPSCNDYKELIALLGLVEGGSRAGQGSQSKQVTMQDQVTNPIMIEDDDDNQSNSVDNRTLKNQANSNYEIHAINTQNNLENQSNVNSGDNTNVQESESQSRRNSLRRQTSPRITRKQEKFQALLQELSTPAKKEKVENVDEKENADGSVS